MAAPLDDELKIGEWQVDPSLDTIRRGAEVQKLEPRTMRLLLCLAGAPGSVISVDRLLADVWTGVIVGPASVYQAVSQLRRLLGDTDETPTYIVNVPRKGYRLIAAVERVPRAPAILSPAIRADTASDATPPGPPAVLDGAGAVPSLPVSSATESPPRARSRWAVGAVAVFVIALAAAAVWKIAQTFRNVGPGMASIVVLPFIDLTENKSDQPFCDGLTEELSNWLAQIPTLRVVARTSAFAFRDQGEDVRRIGRELNTNHILEGSMRRSGNSVRVTVQLIDARNGYHLWSANFDQPMDDAVKLQEQISLSVARSMQVRISGEAVQRLLARGTRDPQAYQLYLLSRYSAQQATSAATDREIDLLKQALMTAPDFSLAHTELAYALVNQAYWYGRPVATVADEVESHIRSALQADPRLSAAYAVRGTLRAFQERYDEALKDLNYAISLDPSDMGAIAQIGRIKLVLGMPRDALSFYSRALSVDPLNAVLFRQQCVAASAMGKYEQAEAACLKALKLAPRNASISEDFAWLAESRGRLREALTRNADAIGAEPDRFELYWDRATFLLSVNRAPAARSVIERGRSSAGDEEAANMALMRVVYAEEGKEALKAFIARNHIDQSVHATTLFEAAHAHLLLNEGTTARALLEHAMKAPDRPEGYAEQPWYALGENTSVSLYRLELATAYVMLGDQTSANRELDAVLTLLDRMIAAGVERYGTYELRAKSYALLGRNDDAMSDLVKAVRLGWRQEWWATHEPYFASLQSRADFQALMAQVRRANTETIQAISGHELFTPDTLSFLAADASNGFTNYVQSRSSTMPANFRICGTSPGPCAPAPR